MTTVLRINASARKTRSLSRELADSFFKEWISTRQSDQIIVRDVGMEPPPAVTEEWIAAAFTEKKTRTEQQNQALTVSDELIDEFIPADVIVFSTPMYNYGMPASLKAWFDQVIRIGRTFSFDLSRGEQPIQPMQSRKTAVVLSASGEGHFFPGEKNELSNHLHPHLFKCCELLGVEHQFQLGIEFQEFGDNRFEKSKAEALAAIPGLVREIMENL